MALGFTDPGGSRPARPTFSRPERTRIFNTTDPGLSSGQLGYTPSKKSSSNNNQSAPVVSNQSSVSSGGQSGSNMNAAQAVLGRAYNQAINMGYKPSELNNQLSYAQDFGRGINVPQFQENLNRYDAFQNRKGDLLQYDGKTYGNVLRPQITANAPTTGQFFGDIAGGIGNLFSAAGDFVLGGGTLGAIVDAAKQKFSQGKDFVQSSFDPGNINDRVNALSPEQRAEYFRLFTSGVPYQQAFQQATGMPFANGGIATLN